MPDSAMNEFSATLSAGAPPPGWPELVKALWYEASGDWDRAHASVQAIDSADAARVHALLHRIEGDLDNAGYWYRRAGTDRFEGSIDAERAALVAALLSPST